MVQPVVQKSGNEMNNNFYSEIIIHATCFYSN